MFRNTLIVSALALAGLVVGCNKPASYDSGESARQAETWNTSEKARDVDAPGKGKLQPIDLGKDLNEKGEVGDGSLTFVPGESIFASVDAKNVAAGTSVVAVIKDSSGNVVHREVGTLPAPVNDQSSFSMSKSGGLPIGEYVLEITLGTGDAQVQKFTVKDKNGDEPGVQGVGDEAAGGIDSNAGDGAGNSSNIGIDRSGTTRGNDGAGMEKESGYGSEKSKQD